jgi:hypothetical protein
MSSGTIYLEPRENANPEVGQMWCEDRIKEDWIEYVRADVHKAKIEELEADMAKAMNAIDKKQYGLAYILLQPMKREALSVRNNPKDY